MHGTSLKAAGEKARITLKLMESLTYLCNDSKRLSELDTDLKLLLEGFKKDLPHEQQLIVRTSVVSRALKTKRKYAKIRSHQCSQLSTAKKRGKKKAPSKFRNRIGTKADRLRKVNNNKLYLETDLFETQEYGKTQGGTGSSIQIRHPQQYVCCQYALYNIIMQSWVRAS